MVSYALASSQFVLKRTIGQFLLKDLDLDKLDVQLSGGQLTLFELQLNTFVCPCANVKIAWHREACETAH
jgi:autophagy-related protein 2